MNEQVDQNAKEFHARMDQIPGALPVLKGSDSKTYTQFPFKPSVTPELIPNRFKMPDITKYDETSDPKEHITFDTPKYLPSASTAQARSKFL